jgi:hypothetical protein
MAPDIAEPLHRHYRPPGPCVDYPSAQAFIDEDLDLIDRTEEVEIQTSVDGGAAHRTIIWAVVDGGDVLIRSYIGPDARWYREATANPNVVLHVDGRALSARVAHAGDPDSIARASAAFARKYASDPATPRLNRAEVLPLTLRLDPA